jgi:hypothetical protein
MVDDVGEADDRELNDRQDLDRAFHGCRPRFR